MTNTNFVTKWKKSNTPKRILTISSNGSSLRQQETVLAFPGGNLSVRELAGEFRLFVVFEVDIVFGDVDFESGDRSNSADLRKYTTKSTKPR